VSKFYENGKQNLPSLKNDWVIDSRNGCEFCDTGAVAAGWTSNFI